LKTARVLILLLLVGCAGETSIKNAEPRASGLPGVVMRPIVFDEQRRQLSLEYLANRYGIEQQEPTIVPKVVVVHWTVIPTADATFDAFDPAVLPGARQEISSASALNVSSQYLVDRDGTIFQLLPEQTMARHTIGLNHVAIGIENVGNGTDLPLTDAQLASNVAIVRYLSGKYDLEYLIGHYEYTLFEGHTLWKERNKAYRTEKTDPGEDFMQRLRTVVADLKLQGPPAPD
jgi:N-acetyl-anhydromuramyl-L-alanine amidase AmpD